MQVVFLDRESLPVRFNPPSGTQSYREYPLTHESQVVERLQDADVAILNKVKLTKAAIEQLPLLKMVSITATGYDCVDVDAARERGIAVAHVKDYATTSVPEHVFMMILALRRNLVGYQQLMRLNAWSKAKHFCVFDGTITDLAGSTLGLLGFGSLGKAVAQLGQGFGMRVIYHTPSRIGQDSQCVDLDTLWRESDVLSLHCPLTPKTLKIINTQTLTKMRRNCILINTARGGLIDELALKTALLNGQIQAAGLDVLATEPPPADHPLLQLNIPQLLITPHVAWGSQSAMERLADGASRNVEAWANHQSFTRVV